MVKVPQANIILKIELTFWTSSLTFFTSLFIGRVHVVAQGAVCSTDTRALNDGWLDKFQTVFAPATLILWVEAFPGFVLGEVQAFICIQAAVESVL